MKKSGINKKELFCFLIGGGSAVLVDFFVYQLLMAAGMERTLSKGLSFVCGSIIGFIINKLWTFESKRFATREIIKYIFLYSLTASINAWVNRLTLSIYPVELFGFFAATGISTILNFLGQKYFVFRK